MTDRQLYNLLKVAQILATDDWPYPFRVPVWYRHLFYQEARIGFWRRLFTPKKAELAFYAHWGIWPQDSILSFSQNYNAAERRAYVLTKLLSLFEGTGTFTHRYEAVMAAGAKS